MMKKILFIATIAILTSCNGFLNLKPYDEISSTLVYESAELAEKAVIGAYSNASYDYISADLSRVNWDAFAGVIDPYYENYMANYLLLNGNTRTNEGIYVNYWKRLYEGVARANEVIENMPNVPNMDEATKAKRVAECKFLRAWHYYKLNSLWGGVPIYDKNLPPTEYTKGRNTAEEVWDFIINDLSSIITAEVLPGKYASSSADYGRITMGAVYALRAKVYMWKKMWAEAENDLKMIAPLGYKLLNESYDQVFKLKNETCDEMIYSARMVELSGWGNAFSRSYGPWQVAGKGGNNTFYMNQQFVDSYQCANGKDFNWNDFIPGYNEMDPKARSVYFLRDNMTPSEISAMADYGADMTKYLPSGNEARLNGIFNARDPRLNATIIAPNSAYSGGFYGAATDYYRRWPFRNDQAPANDIKTKANENFFYTIRKFVVEGIECTNETFNPVDIPVIRYAGVLIDLAECLNEQGKTAEAITELNKVRSRAGVANYTTLNQVDLRTKIVKERRWELALEEVLYYDELRCGTWKEFRFAEGNGLCEPWGTSVYKNSWGGDHYKLWPLPATEVEKNRNLTQNPGWIN